jgi:putative tricarboxylic transport membrane protein
MNSERISSLILLLLAVFILVESRRYSLGTIGYPGPGFLPMLLGIAIGLMALALFIVSRTRTPSRKSSWPDREGFIKVGAIFAGVLLFAFFIDVSGYLLNTFLLFVLLLRPVGRQSWSLTLLVSFVGVLASYLLFDLWLKVQLPRGVWFQ